MITTLDNEFVESIIEKYGTNLKKINLSNNGEYMVKNANVIPNIMIIAIVAAIVIAIMVIVNRQNSMVMAMRWNEIEQEETDRAVATA